MHLACFVALFIIPAAFFPNFTVRLQEAESNRLCRRLQLKDIIPVEMQRLTKYPLLLENIAKYTGGPHAHSYTSFTLLSQAVLYWADYTPTVVAGTVLVSQHNEPAQYGSVWHDSVKRVLDSDNE